MVPMGIFRDATKQSNYLFYHPLVSHKINISNDRFLPASVSVSELE